MVIPTWTELLADIDAAGRQPGWWLRVIPFALFVWVPLDMGGSAGQVTGLICSLNFGIHELGHLFWGFAGEWVAVLGGSLSQCLLPFVAAWMFWSQRDWFAVTLCGPWLATDLFYVGWYMADAVKQEGVPLTIGGREGIHDWWYLFESLGLLGSCETIGALTAGLGWMAFLAGTLAGGAVLARMAMASRTGR